MQQTQTKHHRSATVFQKLPNTEKAVIKFCRETENSMQDNIITDCQYLYTCICEYIHILICTTIYEIVCMHKQCSGLNVLYKLTFDGCTCKILALAELCIKSFLSVLLTYSLKAYLLDFRPRYTY